MPKIFIKEHSREYSLFRIYALHENYCIFSPQLFNYEVKGVCLVYQGQELVSAYYTKDSWEGLLKHVGIKAQNKEFVKKEVNALLKYFDELMPYFLGKKNVKSVDELRKVYNTYVQYYLRHGMVLAIPLISSLPEENRKIALNAREKVQEYGETIEIVFQKALQLLYPHLKDKVQFILPQEVWSGEVEKSSMLKKIEERQNGYVFYQGKLYSGENVDDIVQKLGVELSAGAEVRRVFVRGYGREFSLLRAYTWQMIMRDIYTPVVGEGVNEACYVYRQGEDLVKIYYEPSSMEKLFEGVAKNSQDKDKTMKQIKDSLKYFEKLKPYYVEEKTAKNIKEFKKLYDIYFQYWYLGSLVWILPNVEAVDAEIRKAALKAREKTQEFSETIEFIFEKFIDNNFPHLKNKSRFILPEEIWSREIESKDIVKKIAEREKGFMLYKGKMYVGENIDQQIDELGIVLSEGVDKSKQSKELTGQIAQKGQAKGAVKLVSSLNDLDKVEQGDILVAAMTMPKYLPAMKRAAAFVTDEGGVTCHAAIVSREMKKPCVIGTKIATQVLKTGDLVEVDADKGIVKILNEKRE